MTATHEELVVWLQEMIAKAWTDEECLANEQGYMAGRIFRDREPWYECFQRWYKMMEGHHGRLGQDPEAR